MRRNANAALLTAGLMVWGGMAAAQATATKKSGSGNAATQAFLAKAAQANLAEVELGKLATDKGESDEVKRYGQHMVEDHGKANKELQELAHQEGATLPTYTDKPQQAAKARLEKLSGAAFDRAYAAQMVRDHQAAVGLFKSQANAGRDPEVKAWAAKMLPNLEEHLKQARALTPQKGASR